MKRMALLTALTLVFSLFTVTAAIAGSGPGTGDSEQSGELNRVQALAQPNDAACQGDECPVGERVRTQEQAQENVAECPTEECPTGEPTKTQTQTKSGECLADDCSADEALMAREQTRERFVERVLEMCGAENAEVEAQYRLIMNLMLQNMFRFRAMFI
jgi:hypothetical protein